MKILGVVYGGRSYCAEYTDKDNFVLRNGKEEIHSQQIPARERTRIGGHFTKFRPTKLLNRLAWGTAIAAAVGSATAYLIA